jgi:hypothetical protein
MTPSQNQRVCEHVAAVLVRLRELMLEPRENPKLIEKARVDAEDFLRRAKVRTDLKEEACGHSS